MLGQQRLFSLLGLLEKCTCIPTKANKTHTDCNHEIICTRQWIPEYVDQIMGASGVFRSCPLYIDEYAEMDAAHGHLKSRVSSWWSWQWQHKSLVRNKSPQMCKIHGLFYFCAALWIRRIPRTINAVTWGGDRRVFPSAPTCSTSLRHPVKNHLIKSPWLFLYSLKAVSLYQLLAIADVTFLSHPLPSSSPTPGLQILSLL